ncbi:MAG: DsbA family protein [Pseudomonadota bacterium]|nr:DsbA family protein [Pseudomonadota bacterium]
MTSSEGPALAQNGVPPAITADQKKSLERIVREYILENPEIIPEAIKRLEQKQLLAASRADKEAVVANTDEIYNDPDAPVAGNPNGDVTIVEFFDYRCGVCKRIYPVLDELIKTDANIRRVYKVWPILGPKSVLAAQAVIASRKQGKYHAFHKVMMEANSSFELTTILNLGKLVGMDTEQLERDIKGPEVEAIIRKNHALANKLRLTGTPSFVIGNILLRGGRDLESLRQIVADARASIN